METISCADCSRKLRKKSGSHRRCKACAKKRHRKQRYESAVKNGYIQHPGVGRAKPMLLGDKNGNWQGGALPWQREHFRGTECERCGSSDEIELHHRDRDPTNRDESNLETLCFTCHRMEHRKEPEHPTQRFYAHGNN